MTASFEGRSTVVTASLGQMDGFPILPVPRHLAAGINMGWHGTEQGGMGDDVCPSSAQLPVNAQTVVPSRHGAQQGCGVI